MGVAYIQGQLLLSSKDKICIQNVNRIMLKRMVEYCVTDFNR